MGVGRAIFRFKLRYFLVTLYKDFDEASSKSDRIGNDNKSRSVLMIFPMTRMSTLQPRGKVEFYDGVAPTCLQANER